MFDTIKGIIGDIAAGAIKDQRIALSQEQLGALDLKLRESLHGVTILRAENARLSQHVTELEQLVADRDAQIQELTVTAQQPRTGDRTETENQILVFLSQHAGATDRAISAELGVSTEKIRFHVAELEQADFVYGQHFYTGQASHYHIGQEGRRYLIERDLLK